MKRALITLVLAALAFGAWRYLAHDPAPSGPSYEKARIQLGDIKSTIVATGVVEPRNRLEIKPPIGGRVETVEVNEGQDVGRGAVLVWMSSTERAALLDAARAQGEETLKRWEALYKPVPIVAPLSGTIIARKVEPGQTVAVQDPLVVMSDVLIVKAQVDETDIAKIERGQKAIVTLDAFPRDHIPGSVAHIAYEAETINNVTIYRVDVMTESIPPFMRSGMTADVTFVVWERLGVPRVPVEALVTEGESTYVLQGAPDAPARREVRIGESDTDHAQVLSGLSEGDEILVPTLDPIPERRELTNPFLPGRRRGGNR